MFKHLIEQQDLSKHPVAFLAADMDCHDCVFFLSLVVYEDPTNSKPCHVKRTAVCHIFQEGTLPTTSYHLPGIQSYMGIFMCHCTSDGV